MWPFPPRYPEADISSLYEEYDYIVVGGGTAGCVLANRLSRDDPARRVLLVERGPLADTWSSGVPLLSADFASDGSRTHARTSEFQSILGRTIDLYTGQVLGGTSRINQMIYTRGLPGEYDAWKAKGRRGWGWEDLRPYFLKSERALYQCDPQVHGTKGEWCNRTNEDFHFKSFYHVVDASTKLGLPYIDDICTPTNPPVGCARVHFTRDAQERRSSTYHAFLPREFVGSRSNLHVCTNVLVEKLQIERQPNGRSIVRSVNVLSPKTGKIASVRVRHEVILSAGPFGSPHVLMLSGIGPEEHLKEHGISVYKNLPAVGSNLEDHFGASVAFHTDMSDSLVVLLSRPWVFIVELFRYLLFSTGMLLAPVLQLAIFTSSELLDASGRPSQKTKATPHTLPDVEIMPMAYDSSDQPFPKTKGVFSFLAVLLRPQSKGTVRLTSKDPQAPLRIDPRYLSNPADLPPLRAVVKLALRLRDQMRAQGYRLDDWGVPEGEDDASLDKFIKARNRTTYHYTSTCRMAPEDDPHGGVVDDELRVYGVENLRVADSSIFPWVPGCHTQAPTVCVAEKCADMVLAQSKS